VASLPSHQTAVNLLARVVAERGLLLGHLEACGVVDPPEAEIEQLQGKVAAIRRRMTRLKVVGTLELNLGLLLVVLGVLSPALFSILLGWERSLLTGAVQWSLVLVGGLLVRQYFLARQRQADAEGVLRRTLFQPEPLMAKLQRVEAFLLTGRSRAGAGIGEARTGWNELAELTAPVNARAVRERLALVLDRPPTDAQALAFATQLKESSIKLLACAWLINAATVMAAVALAIAIAAPFANDMLGTTLESYQVSLLQTLIGVVVTGILLNVRRQYTAKRDELREAIALCAVEREPFAAKTERLVGALARISGGMRIN
jgi:hypothetical protein